MMLKLFLLNGHCKNMFMKAQEARDLAQEVVDSHKSNVSKQLLDDVERRLLQAVREGKMEVSLNSLSDIGEGVRGIGFYLSESVFKSLTKLLEIEGYRIEVLDKPEYSIKHVKVRW